jgi:hypothetical protein
MKYTGNINSYTFIMKEEGDDVIEVWSDMDAEFPESYIYLKEGEIKNERQFHLEISDWWMRIKN